MAFGTITSNVRKVFQVEELGSTALDRGGAGRRQFPVREGDLSRSWGRADAARPRCCASSAG
jgi:hypothetical protein